MSQFGGSQHRAAAQGPYGPDNPPPPPPGKPDDKRDHPHAESLADQDSTSKKGPGRAYLHRKLNSRQRKNRKEHKAASNSAQDLRRSRSPSRASQGSMARSSKRQSLRDARQFTPDHIMDETYGRLSPREVFRNARQESYDQTDFRSNQRLDWPDDPPKLPLDEARLSMQMESELQGQNHPYGRYDHGPSLAPRDNDQEPDWTPNTRPISPTSFSGAHSNQTFDIQEEVAWDDDGAFDMTRPFHASKKSKTGYQRPYQAGFDSYKPYPSTQGAAHPISPSRKRDWKRRPCEENNNKAQRSHFQEQRGTNVGQYPPQAQFVKSSNNDRDAGTFDLHRGFATKERSDISPKIPLPANEDDKYSEALMRTNPPESMYDLRKYDAKITKMHDRLPRNQAYRNGNGKAAPHVYGSAQGLDLGLCFVTFCTNGWCEMGVKCAWRHHPLTKAEREWILVNGRDRGKDFLERLPKNWASPEIPVPGASMHNKRN